MLQDQVDRGMGYVVEGSKCHGRAFFTGLHCLVKHLGTHPKVYLSPYSRPRSILLLAWTLVPALMCA